MGGSELPLELARNPNAAKIFRATFIPCPRCNQAIRKVACNVGSFFVTCENYLESSSRKSTRCGQKMFIVALEGIAVVAPVQKEDFQRWLRTYPTALEVFTALGIVVDRGPEELAKPPIFNCKGCGDPKDLADLFGGSCRRCAGLEQREA